MRSKTNNPRTPFLSDFKDIDNLQDDKDRADMISKTFWLLGFETLNLEIMKEAEGYKKLNSIPHVDVLAFLSPSRLIVAVEEGELKKRNTAQAFYAKFYHGSTRH